MENLEKISEKIFEYLDEGKYNEAFLLNMLIYTELDFDEIRLLTPKKLNAKDFYNKVYVNHVYEIAKKYGYPSGESLYFLNHPNAKLAKPRITKPSTLNRLIRNLLSRFNKSFIISCSLKNKLVDEYIDSLKFLPKEEHESKYFVYIVKCNEFYKVGVTSNLNNRVKGIQTGNPYDLELSGYFYFDTHEEARDFENDMHKALKGKNTHVRGEWFKLTNSILNIFNKMDNYIKRSK